MDKLLTVINKNNEFIENITKDTYLSEEYLLKLYVNGFVDVYDESIDTVILYTHDEFKLYQKDLKQRKKEQTNPDVLKKIHSERQKKYYHENIEAMRNYHREYRLKKKNQTGLEQETDNQIDNDVKKENKVKEAKEAKLTESERYKKYYQKNKEKIIARVKEYYHNNKDTINVKKKEYIQDNREKINQKKVEYYHKKKKCIEYTK